MIDSCKSLIDGIPSVIEIGHPTRIDRTYLLILNADIVLPDGSYYVEIFTANDVNLIPQIYDGQPTLGLVWPNSQ